MPADKIIGAIAAAGSAIANPFLVASQNRKNREFAREERELQYQSELEFWRLNNAYNHPTEQMKRLREGGLNPHLVYGTGAVGNSSSMPHAPAQAKWQGEAPQFQPEGAIGLMDTYTNIQAKQAQTDNFREQNTLLKQEQELRRIGILQKLLDYDIADSTKSAVIERVLLGLDKTRSEIMNIDTRTEREAANISNDQVRVWADVVRTNTGVMDSQMRRKLMQAGLDRTLIQIKGDEIVNGINSVKLKLWEDGINPEDPMYMRVIVAAIQKILGEPITDNLLKK